MNESFRDPSTFARRSFRRNYLYRVFVLPIMLLWVWMLGSQQGGPTVNGCTGPVLSMKNPWHLLAWLCQKYWHSSYDQLAITLIHCQVSSSFVLLTSCENGWECRRQPSHFWASSRELETSTWVSTYYVDEDHPRWSLLPGSGAAWSQRTGWESTSLETDVFV